MKYVLAIAVFVTVLAVGGVVGLFVAKRMRTGQWALPDKADVTWVKQSVSPSTGPDEQPSRTIYLHRHSIILTAGEDDAPNHRSSVVASTGHEQIRLPGFSGSNKRWNSIVRCVEKVFAPFDVLVTDRHPPEPNYTMVVVGGRSNVLGGAHRHVGGLAPFNGGVISKPVVFAFADALKNQTRAVCHAVAMEVGHAYGLDHAHHCKDVMTYLQGCGNKSFRDKDVACGEKEARECKGGEATQNSYRHLIGVLGLRPRKK